MGSLIISIFFLILGGFFTINSIPLIKSSGSNVNLESGVFPMFLGISLMVISIFMIVSYILININKKIKGKKLRGKNNNNSEVTLYAIKDIVLITIFIIIFIAIWQLINFFVALIILIFALFKLFGVFKLKNYIIFAISLSLVIYVVFILVLKLNL